MSIQKVVLNLPSRGINRKGGVYLNADDLITDLAEFTAKLENSGVRATFEQVTEAIRQAADAIKRNTRKEKRRGR